MRKTVKIVEFKAMVSSILKDAGQDQENVDIIIDHLLQEELIGKETHGFYRFPGIINCLRSNAKPSDISVSVNANCISVEGGGNIGLVAVKKACIAAIEVTNKYNFSITSVKNYIGNTGALGYYSRFIAESGLISIAFCNSEAAVAPWGGKDAIIGTNPISFGIPNGNNPIIADFATSTKTYGELMLAAKKGISIPKGNVLDKDGYPSTNPNDANLGCQLPMAEHKGYALGFAIEILAGLFIGAKSGNESVVGSNGLFLLTFKPDLFVSQEQFYENLIFFINEVKDSSVAPGFDRIKIPGEGAAKTYEEKLARGEFDISESTYNEILEIFNKVQ